MSWLNINHLVSSSFFPSCSTCFSIVCSLRWRSSLSTKKNEDLLLILPSCNKMTYKFAAHSRAQYTLTQTCRKTHAIIIINLNHLLFGFCFGPTFFFSLPSLAQSFSFLLFSFSPVLHETKTQSFLFLPVYFLSHLFLVITPLIPHLPLNHSPPSTSPAHTATTAAGSSVHSPLPPSLPPSVGSSPHSPSSSRPKTRTGKGGRKRPRSLDKGYYRAAPACSRVERK